MVKCKAELPGLTKGNTMITQTITEFINGQVATWGQEYVDDLFDRNYFPVLTSAGWRWLYLTNSQFAELQRDEQMALLNSSISTR